MKILQNQDHFSTELYRKHATPLVVALENSVLRPLKKFRFNWLAAGVMMHLLKEKYEVVVTVGHRETLSFGAMNRLFPWKKKVHVAKEIYFEYDGGGASLRERAFRRAYRFALKKVDMIVVNASDEISPYARLFALPESRFRFIPLPSNITEPTEFREDDSSILAVGYSLRDWETFFRAVDGLPWRSIVIAARNDVQNFKPPSNVELPFDMPRAEFLKYVEKAAVVVIPLIETIRSTGQTTFLEAMAYGKPVIVADVVGARDYIIDGRNGLKYRPGQPEDLREKICSLMSNNALRETLAREGLQSIRTRFNKKNHARTLLACCRECLAEKEHAKDRLRIAS